MCGQAGAANFLQKPAPPKLLLERSRAALDSDRQARAMCVYRRPPSAAPSTDGETCRVRI
jgi:FixJ family two-component response regulator